MGRPKGSKNKKTLEREAAEKSTGKTTPNAAPVGEKRKPGRPKGSKNRKGGKAPTAKVAKNAGPFEELLTKYPPQTKEQKKAVKEILDGLPPSGRGRPSKETVAARKVAEEKLKRILYPSTIPVEETSTQEETSADEQETVATPKPKVATGLYPVFKYGDNVRLKDVAKSADEHRKEGTVLRHEPDSQYVFVDWGGDKDGHWKNWQHVATLDGFVKMPSSKRKSAA